MDALMSPDWILNPDFDEGSILADFNCEDFPSLANPACSPSSFAGGQEEAMNDAWREAFSKLAKIEENQSSTGSDVTLGSGFSYETESDSEDVQGEYVMAISCPCCGQDFTDRNRLVSHLEKVHHRCVRCEYKFETAEELAMHQTMCVYNPTEDDNLSISGDEDTSTLMSASLSMVSMDDVGPYGVTEPEDNKDSVWDEIRAMQAADEMKNPRTRQSSSSSTCTNIDRGGGFNDTTTPNLNPAKTDPKKKISIKVEPDASVNDPSFEFESTVKPPVAKIKPNSLLKKRLRPNLATKVRGRYGKGKNSAPLAPPSPPSSPTPGDQELLDPVTPDDAEQQEEEELEQPTIEIKEEPQDLEGELTCEVCEMTFEGYQDMEQHAATHNVPDTNGVSCVICGEHCASFDELNAHEKEKHGTFAYKCGDCNRIFNTQLSFKEHEKYHSDYKQCPLCDKKFLNAERLARHQSTRCNSSEIKCIQCSAVFNTIEALQEHKQTVHGRNVYRCDKCGKTFDHKQTLAVHKMSHTGEEKPFKCKVCGKGFKTYWYYVVHEKCYCKHIDKTNSIVPPYGTDASKKKFYQCKICSRVFPHISHLKVHNYIHTGERPYKCNSCGKGFTQKQNLKVHERVHTGEKPYICNSCGFGFKDLGNLRRHQYIHTGEKPHACDLCDKRFTWVESLRRHKRTHLKQRPYECKICKREFVHLGHLRIHELVHKQDERPFQCNICGKSFTMLSSLSIHEHIHLERKPYPCDMCQRTFMTASALNTHKQTHVQRMASAYRQAYRDKFSF